LLLLAQQSGRECYSLQQQHAEQQTLPKALYWCVLLIQDAVKPGKDGGDNDGDSSEGDDEGIDAENSNMRHYSNGNDEFEIDRPSATLKHPRRSGKPYVIKPAKGDSIYHCIVFFHVNFFRFVCPCML